VFLKNAVPSTLVDEEGDYDVEIRTIAERSICHCDLVKKPKVLKNPTEIVVMRFMAPYC
jgi:hypothetical protein